VGSFFVVGEIHPSSAGQHKWILIATNYFIKWVEANPTRHATDAAIIQFLENIILSRFGYPRRLITNYAQAFKSNKMVELCSDYNII
jgi:hypothetical protein